MSVLVSDQPHNLSSRNGRNLEYTMQSLAPTVGDKIVLSQMRLFAGLTKYELSEVSQHTQIYILERGELLFEQGSLADRFFGVVSGLVKVFTTQPDGTESVLGLFTKCETFAEAIVFTRENYPATAEAVSPSRVIGFKNDFFADKILSEPELCQGMFASLSIHWQHLTQDIELLQGQNSEQRLLRFLVSLCDVKSGACSIRLPYDKSLVAGRLGMKPETLSRSFRKLRKWGVTVYREEVIVSEVARLREFAT